VSAGGDPAASAWLAESARMLERDGRYADALDAWARVTDAAPDDPAGWRERGRLLQILSRLEPSRECLETAVRLDPNDLDARLYLARTRQRLGDGDGALAEYEAAMRVAPGDMRARCGVAFALERRHDLTRAASILDDGLAAEPGHPLATLIRARVDRRQGDAAGARDRLTALLATDPDDEIRSRAAYELARCLEKLGDHPGAFEAATIGNETQARTPVARAIRSDDALAFIEDQKVFSRDHFRRWASHPVPDDGPPPIFLVGFPRSGTTMTEQILGAHPALAVSNEQDLFRPALSRLIEGLPTDLSAEAAMEAATPERIAEARLHYRASAARVIAAQPGAERLVDKYPPNLGMLAYVQRVFPDARVVVALRDPREMSGSTPWPSMPQVPSFS
jgi:Flp pilus assembly protein TadD